MKNILFIFFVCIASFVTAQTEKLTKKAIIKDGTTITYVEAKLYKSTDFESSIKEREKRDTLKINIKKINNKLRVIVNNNFSDKNIIYIDSEKLGVFTTAIETNNKKIQYVDFTLSALQYKKDDLFVDEGMLKPSEYNKSERREKITFLYNGKNTTQSITYYVEKKPDPYFYIDLAFLDLESFPIQTHVKYISDSKGYYSGSVFRLVSIETKK